MTLEMAIGEEKVESGVGVEMTGGLTGWGLWDA